MVLLILPACANKAQEQKLFDMGSSVADVTRSLGSKSFHRLAESAIDPRELLWGILQTLSQIRGSPSYLFPSLLEQCKIVLGLDCTITMGNFLPTLGAAFPDQLSDQLRPAGEHGWGMLETGRDRPEIQELDRQNESVAPLSAVSQGASIGFEGIFCSES